jgi:hypothetical protein
LAVQTQRRLRAKLPEMSRSELPKPDPSDVQRFVAAVRALSDDPRPANVERYLAASRALDEQRGLSLSSGRNTDDIEVVAIAG